MPFLVKASLSIRLLWKNYDSSIIKPLQSLSNYFAAIITENNHFDVRNSFHVERRFSDSEASPGSAEWDASESELKWTDACWLF